MAIAANVQDTVPQQRILKNAVIIIPNSTTENLQIRMVFEVHGIAAIQIITSSIQVIYQVNQIVYEGDIILPVKGGVKMSLASYMLNVARAVKLLTTKFIVYGVRSMNE